MGLPSISLPKGFAAAHCEPSDSVLHRLVLCLYAGRLYGHEAETGLLAPILHCSSPLGDLSSVITWMGGSPLDGEVVTMGHHCVTALTVTFSPLAATPTVHVKIPSHGPWPKKLLHAFLPCRLIPGSKRIRKQGYIIVTLVRLAQMEP